MDRSHDQNALRKVGGLNPVWLHSRESDSEQRTRWRDCISSLAWWSLQKYQASDNGPVLQDLLLGLQLRRLSLEAMKISSQEENK